MAYWQNRNRIKVYAIRVIISTWIISAILAVVPILGVIPGDKYAIHPMGMTLSVKMDELMLYQSIMCISLMVIWTVNIASYVDYRKKQLRRFNSHKAPTTNTDPPAVRHSLPTVNLLLMKLPLLNTKSSAHKEESKKGNKRSKDSNFRKTQSQKKRDQNLSQSLTSVCIAFSVCYVPLVITQFLSNSPNIHLTKYPLEFNSTANKIFNISMFFASRLVLSNSFLNGIIYSCKDKGFLLATKTAIFKFHSKHNLTRSRYTNTSYGMSTDF